MSVKAITRIRLADLEAGSLVYVSSMAFKSALPNARFPAVPDTCPHSLLWLQADQLLPYSQFLKRQPFDEYWMLGHLRSMSEGSEKQFLSDISRQSLGHNGFRFESIGELMHYLRTRDLNPVAFKILHVKNIDEC